MMRHTISSLCAVFLLLLLINIIEKKRKYKAKKAFGGKELIVDFLEFYKKI